ncbi:hypothetical protein E2562_020692 [Oryza meyeriana var. granulata]|uniref:Uncharacterized protein n=1 Tax=Oryza meyeriana var. granulata TaxID=110450 RepID=A0A6G1EN02_9ORYZ|nr:hypothetical protein E2562_020692 [Oryza meyeriana var. granulata]
MAPGRHGPGPGPSVSHTTLNMKVICEGIAENLLGVCQVFQAMKGMSDDHDTLHMRRMDAKHGAKSMANRTIMALWKARSLSTEYKMQTQSNNTLQIQSEDSEIFVGVEDAKNL